MIPRRWLGNTGLSVATLGYGGAPIGFSAPEREQDFVELLRRVLALGINFFDTAPDYRRSEEFLGVALQGQRDQVVLASKCGRVQTPVSNGWDVREDWTESGVLRIVEGSLRRLQTDHLDLLQLHSPPLWALDDGAAIRGMQKAKEQGKVLHMGVSADNDEARRAIELGVFETLQVSYSILQQEAGTTIIPAAVQKGMGIIVKQPIANGIPNLKERPTHPDWNWKWDVAQRLDWQALGAPGNRMDLALQWVLSDPQISTAIVGTTNLEHPAANAQIASGPLPDQSVWRLAQQEYTQARSN